jgi:hypothetical protein
MIWQQCIWGVGGGAVVGHICPHNRLTDNYTDFNLVYIQRNATSGGAGSRPVLYCVRSHGDASIVAFPQQKHDKKGCGG